MLPEHLRLKYMHRHETEYVYPMGWLLPKNEVLQKCSEYPLFISVFITKILTTNYLATSFTCLGDIGPAKALIDSGDSVGLSTPQSNLVLESVSEDKGCPTTAGPLSSSLLSKGT